MEGLEPLKTQGIPESLHLRLEHCSFSYQQDDSENSRLDDVNLDLTEMLAVVGLSGEGKSTLLKIIQGDEKPDQGQCVLGFSDISTISPLILSAAVRVYTQEKELYDRTLHDNITLFKTGVSESEYKALEQETHHRLNEIQSSVIKHTLSKEDHNFLCEMLGLTDSLLLDTETIAKLDQDAIELLAAFTTARKYYMKERYEELVSGLGLRSLDTDRLLGTGGDKVSGGEKERICLARFFLSTAPSIYILDEPFTNLDLITERDCLEVTERFLKGQRGILISHKLNIVKRLADKISVLEHGVLSDPQTHLELLEQNGLYKKMVSQFTESSHL